MKQRPNAKLTPKGRETLVSRIEPGIGVAEAARQMGVSRQTAGEVRRRGPAAPVRHERERPGEPIRVDVKKVARIPPGGGWRALGRGNDRSRGRSGAGSSRLHVAVGDFGRVAYAELLPDGRKTPCGQDATPAPSPTHAWRLRPGRPQPARPMSLS